MIDIERRRGEYEVHVIDNGDFVIDFYDSVSDPETFYDPPFTGAIITRDEAMSLAFSLMSIGFGTEP